MTNKKQTFNWGDTIGGFENETRHLTLSEAQNGRDLEKLSLAMRLQEYVDKKSIDIPPTHIEGGEQFYACPFCPSGWGDHHTGGFVIHSNSDGSYGGIPRYYCHRCGETGDIFNLAAHLTGLTNFEDIRQYLLRELGSSPAPSPKRANAPVKAQPKNPAPLKDMSSELAQYHKNVTQTTYFRDRGLSEGTIEKLGLGYNPNYYNTSKKETWRAAIIPVSKHSYVARNTNAQSPNRYDIKGKRELYLSGQLQAQEPIFVVEGYLDAPSILEVGGAAVALGGTSNNKIYDILEEQPPSQPLIVALDNDREGLDKTRIMREKLSEMGIQHFSIAELLGDNWWGFRADGAPIKDANEALLYDRAKFSQTIATAREMAAKGVTLGNEPIEDEPPLELEMSIASPEDGIPEDVRIEWDLENADSPAPPPLKDNISSSGRDDISDEDVKEYLAMSAKARMDAYGDDGIPNRPHIPTGFTKLDKALGGGITHGLTAVGATTGIGKTAFIMHILDNIAKNGGDGLYISVEMEWDAITTRSLSREMFEIALQEAQEKQVKEPYKVATKQCLSSSEISDKAKYSEYSKAQLQLLEKAKQRYREYSEHITIRDNKGGVSAGVIEKTIRTHYKATGRYPVTVVDFLQILRPETQQGRYGDIRLSIDESIQRLRDLTEELGIPIIIISSFNRNGYKDVGTLASFKESGNIEYLSSTVISLEYDGAGGKYFSENIAKARKPRQLVLRVLKGRNADYNEGSLIGLDYYSKANYFCENDIPYHDSDALPKSDKERQPLLNKFKTTMAQYEDIGESPTVDIMIRSIGVQTRNQVADIAEQLGYEIDENNHFAKVKFDNSEVEDWLDDAEVEGWFEGLE